MARRKIIISLFLIAAMAAAMFIDAHYARAQEEPKGEKQLVVVIPIKDWEEEKMIDLALAGFLERRFAAAREEGAAAIILELDTAGGRVDAALKIVEMIKSMSDSGTKVVAYVNDSATSAGALIALACSKIYVSKASTIGSATVVQSTGTTPEKAPEKYQSFMRAQFRSVANMNGYPERLAEAMVDEDIEVLKVKDGDKIFYITRSDLEKRDAELHDKGDTSSILVEMGVVCPKGKLLNMSDKEAVEYGFAKRADNIQEICADLGITNPDIERHEMSWAENAARVLSGPLMSGLLMMIGMLSIYYALAQPGFGIPEALAITCFVIFFWAKFFVGMSGPFEIGIFLLGVILLAVELFLIPGFGFVGGTGIVLILLSIFLSYLPYKHIPDFETRPWEWDYLRDAVISLAVAIIVAAAGFMVLIKYFGELPLVRRLILNAGPQGGLTASAAEQVDQGIVGKEGEAISDLRPSGKAEVAGEIYNVVTEGEYIEQGAWVEVLSAKGGRVVVRKLENTEQTKEA